MNICCIETSPNCDARPADEIVSLVVIHAISLPPDRFGGPGVRQLFLNCLDPSEDPFYAQIQHLRVSAHFFIRRTGELIQFVPPEARAWHAGASTWKGRERCNDFSIGVELEGCDTLPFEPVQYQVLAEASVMKPAALAPLALKQGVGALSFALPRQIMNTPRAVCPST